MLSKSRHGDISYPLITYRFSFLPEPIDHTTPSWQPRSILNHTFLLQTTASIPLTKQIVQKNCHYMPKHLVSWNWSYKSPSWNDYWNSIYFECADGFSNFIPLEIGRNKYEIEHDGKVHICLHASPLLRAFSVTQNKITVPTSTLSLRLLWLTLSTILLYDFSNLGTKWHSWSDSDIPFNAAFHLVTNLISFYFVPEFRYPCRMNRELLNYYYNMTIEWISWVY